MKNNSRIIGKFLGIKNDKIVHEVWDSDAKEENSSYIWYYIDNDTQSFSCDFM